MTVATFLTLVQVLSAMGGAGVAFINIRNDIEKRGLGLNDPLPAEHFKVVKAALAPAQSDSMDFIARLDR